MITIKHSRHARVVIFFVLSYLFISAPVFVFCLLLYCVLDKKFDSLVLASIVIFYFSFLISSRFSGAIWNGSDDVPSYLLAYDAISSGKNAVWAAQYHTRHLDYLFIFYTKVVNYFSGGHRFIYYFLTVYLTFTIFYCFSRRVFTSGGALLALLLFLTYFKNIHLSMHLLRSSLAISIVLYAMTFESSKKYVMYLMSFLIQGSTVLLILPILLLKDRLFNKKLHIALNIKFTIPTFLILALLIFTAYMLFPDGYIFNKLKYIEIRLGLVNYHIIIVNVAFVFLLFFLSGSSLLTYKYRWMGWMNVYVVLVLISFLGLIFNQHVYRFGQQVLYLSPILMVLIFHGFKRDLYVKTIVFCLYSIASYLTYLYVIDLNESDFYYLTSGSTSDNGLVQINYFYEYLRNDISYDDSWRVNTE